MNPKKEFPTANFEEKKRLQAALQLAKTALAEKNRQKEEVSKELAIAVKDLALQVQEKEKRVEQLDALNKELEYQISEKRKKEEELEAANKELESFSYSVSHDLRTPLRAIYGFSRVLLEDYTEKLDEEGKLLFQEIIDNTKRMGQLIDDLLELSRISKNIVTSTNVNIGALVQEVCSELNRINPDKEYLVEIGELPSVQGDIIMLRQLFFNILSNAFKYSSKKDQPVITIEAFQEQKEVVYVVKDNGAGFDQRYSHMMFGIFQRLHSNHEFEGSGVGLAIVEKIIKKHNGKVRAEGKPGQGASFFISLPKQNL